ncbi:MAG TPA: ATP-binding protein [Polyangiales bacterium]|nr:ATP-binding protein [Polyangiales bacterium]
MNLGIRGKLFIASLGLIMIVGLAGGVYLDNQLSALAERGLEQELLKHAQAAREAAMTLGHAPSREALDALADRLGDASGSRITFIARDGSVIGDSALSREGLEHEDNHATRPEFRAAFAGQKNVVRRYSTTTNQDMVYAAVPWHDGQGVVRASTPLSVLREVLAHQRMLVLLAAGLGLIVAVLVSAFASHVAARVLGSFAASARAILTGGQKRLPVLSEDELGHLAGSLNKLAEERSQTITALIRERDRLNAILHGVSEGLLALDRDQRIELANPAALKLLALPADPEGRKLVEVLRTPSFIELVEQAREAPQSAELMLEDPPRQLMVTTAPLRATGGVVVVMHDVTSLRHMESMRRDLVANVSHELRTPVSIIRANAETLMDGALDDPSSARSFVQAILRHSERLSNLLSDLLDLSRIEGGAYPLSLEAVSMRAAVQRAADTLQRSAKAKGLRVETQVEPELYALADSQALDQVLVNLLDNAIKYSFEGGTIDVTAEARDGQVHIVVSDDGPGIQERHRARVFERFYRVDTGRSRALGGTGLGLSIVKHLVVLMHGTVGVEPVEPRGSAFWVRLPTSKAPAAVSPNAA